MSRVIRSDVKPAKVAKSWLESAAVRVVERGYSQAQKVISCT